MTATEILRRLLDERGVWWDYGIAGPTTTRFTVNGVDLTFTPMRDGLICSTILTPEQAIAATLGSCNCPDNCTNGERTETCHEIEDEDTGFIVCSECGAVHDESYTAYYCWCCGRRIEK